MQKQSDIDVGFGRSVRRRRVTIVFAALAVLLVVLATLNLCIGSLNVPIRNASTSVNRNKIATIRLVLEVRSRDQMDSVIRQLQKRQDVMDVFRVTG